MDYLILCIGNREGGDDGVGPYIADKLHLKLNKNMVIDCGTIPENYTGVIKKHQPHHVLIIDAVDMGLLPGKTRIIPPEKISQMHVSTHGIPLSVLIKYLGQYVDHIALIGIQPKQLQGSMTDEIKKSADQLIKLIFENKISEIPKLQ